MTKAAVLKALKSRLQDEGQLFSNEPLSAYAAIHEDDAAEIVAKLFPREK